MYSKEQLDILAFLDQYISETPKEVIEEDSRAISAMKFAGVPASGYFDNFHKYFEGQSTEVQHKQILRIAVRGKQVLNMFKRQSEFGSMSKPYRITVGLFPRFYGSPVYDRPAVLLYRIKRVTIKNFL